MAGIVDLGATPSWGEPVPPILLGLDPLNFIVPYWRKVMGLVGPYRSDSLVAADWSAALDLMDGHPLPTSPAGWNARWRHFLVAVWRLLDNHERRLAVQRATAGWARLGK